MGLAGLYGSCNSHVFRVYSIPRKMRALYYLDQHIHFVIIKNVYFLVFPL